MKRKFAIVLSTLIFLAIFSVRLCAQTSSMDLEYLPLQTKTETHIYDKKGELLYTVYRYDARELSKEVKSALKTNYSDFDIAGVEEVKATGHANSTYFVHVQNGNSLKLVRVYRSKPELVKEYNRRWN